MTFSTTTIIVLFANGLSAVVAAAMLMLVLWQAPGRRMNLLFAFAMLMQLAYSVANGFGRFIDDLNFNEYHATYIAISFFGLYTAAVFFFASEFSEKLTRPLIWMRASGLLLSTGILFALWNNILISDIYPSEHGDGSYNADWTPLGMAVAVMIVVYLLSSAWVLRRLDNARGRALWPGPLLLALGNISNFIIWPYFHLPLQSIFLAAAALYLGLPVLRFELLSPLAQAHIERAQMHAELEEAYQMKTQFLANVSHELRTPLNSIIGYTELVLNGTYGAMNDTQRDRLEKVVRNSKNLLGLINDVLDLNRMESGRVTLDREMIDTQAVLDAAMEIITPLAAQKDLALTRDYEGVPPVYADEQRLRQIVINIAANAVKFTHEGGITIRARVMTSGVQFEIHDTGIGIPKEDFERVFAEFEQVDKSSTRLYEGSGLGMAITKRLVDMHGGRIWLESEVGKGTTFYVTMPARPPFEPAQPAALDAPRSATVLVIDDSAEARLLLNDTLTSAGYTVVTANSGLTGIAQAKELQPDLITLDVMMPGMDGWQVLRALKGDERTRQIPVVIVSIVDNRPLALSLGARAAVPKPLDRQELLHVLRETLLPDDAARPILIVDDRDDDRALIRDILIEQGYVVACAAGGQEALDWLADHDPCLVLLDLVMPEISGFDVLTAMRQHDRLAQTPVIVLTAKTLSDQERAFLQARTAALVAKTENGSDALLQLVARAQSQREAAAVPPAAVAD